MADVHSKEVRSYNMSKIKSKNTSPELIVRKYLFSHGFRYRIHDKNLPGKPDVILKKYKTILFINGCFWHGHEQCKYFILPKTRTDWWEDKINQTIINDKKIILALEQLGWNIITIWECDLRKQNKEKTLINLIEIIKANKKK